MGLRLWRSWQILDFFFVFDQVPLNLPVPCVLPGRVGTVHRKNWHTASTNHFRLTDSVRSKSWRQLGWGINIVKQNQDFKNMYWKISKIIFLKLFTCMSGGGKKMTIEDHDVDNWRTYVHINRVPKDYYLIITPFECVERHGLSQHGVESHGLSQHFPTGKIG